MIRLDMRQGSDEWEQARLGIPTASQFKRIITPKTLKLSEQRHKYKHQLLAEWLTGQSMDSEFVSGPMERGSALEARAVAYYEVERDVKVDRVGFCLRDDRQIGCSPDGLVGDDGGLEIKCPMAPACVGYLLDEKIEEDYLLQVQGGLYITGRKWWDVLGWNPDMAQFPLPIVRMDRDETVIEAIHNGLEIFLSELNDAKKYLLAKGCTPAL